MTAPPLKKRQDAECRSRGAHGKQLFGTSCNSGVVVSIPREGIDSLHSRTVRQAVGVVPKDHPYKRALMGGTVGLLGEVSLNFELGHDSVLPYPQDATWCRTVPGTRVSSNITVTHEVTPPHYVYQITRPRSSSLAVLGSNLRHVTAQPILAALPQCHHTSFPHNMLLQ
jgi:hypothetical protein